MATLKNTIIQDTGSLALPSGTTAQRPNPATDGDFWYNTDTGYPEYYYKGFWADARTGQGGIVTNGLVMLIQPGNPACYPGSGTTLTDLTGNGNNMTLVGSPTYNAAYGGYFAGSGANQFITSTHNGNAAGFTVIAVTRYTANSGGGRIVCSGQPTTTNWLLGHHGNNNRSYYSEGWVNDTNSDGADGTTAGTPANSTILTTAPTVTRSAWAIHCGTGASGIDQYGYWCNGGLVARNNAGNGTYANIGVNVYGIALTPSVTGSTQPSSWQFNMLLCYNRVLTDDEIKKTTAAIRIRNGM